ncbi:hypothetical protein HanPSC8_Chr11g0501311 [Helianthus annuus]|nr:hypothetical protein HanPSC8_Chr11g0501311 [Helianthus annuus]
MVLKLACSKLMAHYFQLPIWFMMLGICSKHVKEVDKGITF